MIFETNIIHFRNARDWKQYHTPRNLAASICIEAAELLELYQWAEEADKERVAEEIADIYIYLITLAHDLNISVEGAVADKLAKNAKKYPVDKCYGRADKYTEI
ncbi:MAG: nucleotide pyrophosphohydrolase [bacterium]